MYHDELLMKFEQLRDFNTSFKNVKLSYSARIPAPGNMGILRYLNCLNRRTGIFSKLKCIGKEQCMYVCLLNQKNRTAF